MATIIKFVQSDHGKPVNLTLNNPDGTALNLTNCDLKFIAQGPNDTGIKFSGDMVVDTPLSGTCHYTPIASDFDEAGNYNCQIQLTNTITGEVTTFPDIIVQAAKKLPTV